VLPGDDGQAFANRLRYLQDDLQPRNSLEAVVIERLAGDLWKSDRSDRSAANRLSFRLRHGPVDQELKDRAEAIESGQHLLWQPDFPLPVGLNEGEAKAKGPLGKFSLANVPSDPTHPARLLLKLESTVAGCDWLLGRWEELRFRLEGPGLWVMEDVWKMVRLLGKIGRIRAMLQRIADADLAEAPVRLAFETGTEGDRQRRYILSYERLVNRKIDTFLKVRKASASGELDLVELEKEIGTEELVELVGAAGITTYHDTGDPRSDDGPDRETRAQHGETLARHPPDQFAPPTPRSARVSDPAGTPNRRSPFAASTLDRAAAGGTSSKAQRRTAVTSLDGVWRASPNIPTLTQMENRGI
jgi:hypothetical protein